LIGDMRGIPLVVAAVVVGAAYLGAQTTLQMLPVPPATPREARSPLIPAPAPAVGSFAIKDESFAFQYYFDHNALRQAVTVGSAIVALTASGNLIRFDLDTLAMTGEHVVVGRATALAVNSAGQLLVGTEDGHVDAVNPGSWAHSTIGSAEGSIVWLAPSGGRGARTVAVVRAPRRSEWWPDHSDKQNKWWEEEERQAAHDAAVVFGPGDPRVILLHGKERDVARAAYAVDPAGRLWMGTDYGEFGGSLRRIDLETGAQKVFKFADNVRGFATAADGALYAFGGTSHFGFEHGYVARLGNDEPVVLREFSNEKPVPLQPSGPVDHLIVAVGGSGFWAVSNHIVFRVDPAMATWSQSASLGGRWFGGAAYSIGNTSTASAVMVDPRAPGDLIAAMGRDGLVRTGSGGERRWKFGGQLELDAIDIWTTSIGTLLLPDIRQSPSAARLGPTGWDSGVFDTMFDSTGDSWYECAIAGDDGKGVTLFCTSNITPGERSIIRVGPDGPKVLERWEGHWSSLWGCLLTTKGIVVIDYRETLEGRKDGKSIEVGMYRSGVDDMRFGRLAERRLLPLDRIDGVDYFLDANEGDLLTLSETASGALQLEPPHDRGRSPLRELYDAVPDGDHWILAAARTELLRYDLATGEKRALRLPDSAERFTTIARDRQRRLWTAGDHVYVSSDDGTHWTMADLPMTSRTTEKRIRANPDVGRGVWLSLGDRGFVVVK
jgi:hypothetical protein